MQKEGFLHDFTSDPIIGLKVGKDAVIDGSFDLLNKYSPNKGSSMFFDATKRLIDYGVDSATQQYDDNLERQKKGGN